jgi:hypothetical protein
MVYGLKRNFGQDDAKAHYLDDPNGCDTTGLAANEDAASSGRIAVGGLVAGDVPGGSRRGLVARRQALQPLARAGKRIPGKAHRVAWPWARARTAARREPRREAKTRSSDGPQRTGGTPFGVRSAGRVQLSRGPSRGPTRFRSCVWRKARPHRQVCGDMLATPMEVVSPRDRYAVEACRTTIARKRPEVEGCAPRQFVTQS